MKLKTLALLTLAVMSFSFNTAILDDCKMYFPIEKGMNWEYQEFDKNGKLNGYSTTTVDDVIASENKIEYFITGTSDDAKRKEKNHFENSFKYVCENGELKMSLDNLIPAETMEGMKDMDIKIVQDEMIFPSSLAKGDALNDGSLTMTVSMSGMQIMEMNINITDRKVEKLEEVTTEAGTYSCALISYKTESKMGFVNTTSFSKDWYSPEVGMVKSEYYNKDNELQSSRVLTAFSK